MRNKSTLHLTTGLDAARPLERGVAVVILLYGLSIFSVLALTVLRNATLESAFRATDNPDLHVVLYAGGAGSPKVVGRLNLPTTWRLQGVKPDESVSVQAPGPVGVALTADVSPGWAYAVQLTPELRVCCDADDSACTNVPWEQQVPQASVTPSFENPPGPVDSERQLQFELSSHQVPSSTDLDPKATAESAFLLKVARVQNGGDSTGAAISCRLQGADRTLATGKLRLTPGVDEQGRVNRVSAGSFELTYSRPK